MLGELVEAELEARRNGREDPPDGEEEHAPLEPEPPAGALAV